VTPAGNNFNDFPDNQLTKCRVFLGWTRIIPPKFLWSVAVRLPHRMDALTDTTQRGERTNERTNEWTDGRLTLKNFCMCALSYVVSGFSSIFWLYY